MTGISISTRTELKDNIRGIYYFINENKPGQALNLLDKAEMNVRIYYNTRGMDCSRFNSIFCSIRNLLRRFQKKRLCRNKLFDYLFELNSELRAGALAEIELKNEKEKPLVALKFIADDLLDDYASFSIDGGHDVIEKNRNVVELIKNDLIEMRELEPMFRDQPIMVRNKCNALLKAINACLMILPQVQGISTSAGTVKLFRRDFEQLFNVITDIFVPVKPEIVPASDGVKEGKIMGELSFSEIWNNKDTHNENNGEMDLIELERKAKAGMLTEENLDGAL